MQISEFDMKVCWILFFIRKKEKYEEKNYYYHYMFQDRVLYPELGAQAGRVAEDAGRENDTATPHAQKRRVKILQGTDMDLILYTFENKPK